PSYPSEPQQPGPYQAPPAYPPQQPQMDMYAPPANTPPVGYPGSPAQPPPQYPVGYPGPQTPASSSVYDQKPPSQGAYPPPQNQPPVDSREQQQQQPYPAYQEASKGLFSGGVPSPFGQQHQQHQQQPQPPSYGGYGPGYAAVDQKGMDFWMRAYPRPAYGPQPCTPQQVQNWNYHINYNPNNKQKPPTAASSSSSYSSSPMPYSNMPGVATPGESGSYYPASAGASPYPQQYQQQQQQQQQQDPLDLAAINMQLNMGSSRRSRYKPPPVRTH
ncbi:hypothetical protein BGZ99_006939, partial [Dissophora globulifera]